METIQELKRICQPHRTSPQKSRDWGYLKHRELSIYVTWVILKLFGRKIKPNHLSIFNILFGLAILWLIALTQEKLLFLFWSLLFYFSFLLDKVDGEIARYQREITLRGAYLDEIYHLFVQNGLLLAFAFNHRFFYFGLVGFIFLFIIRYFNKIRYFVYAKYQVDKGKYLIRKKLSVVGKSLAAILNILPLKLASFARRHDILLLSVFFLSIFYFESNTVWFWFFLVWLLLLLINIMRFVILNFLYIDRDIQLVDEKKL